MSESTVCTGEVWGNTSLRGISDCSRLVRFCKAVVFCFQRFFRVVLLFSWEEHFFLSPNHRKVTQLPLIVLSSLESLKLPPNRVIRAKERLLPLPNGSAGPKSLPVRQELAPRRAEGTPPSCGCSCEHRDLTAQAQPGSSSLGVG